MTSLSNKTYWLIGASDGIGYSLAKKMDELGASLVISSRNREGLEQLGNSLKNNARIVTCDVTDLDSVSTAFSSIGSIDGLVYMAGYYAPMHTHDWNHDEVLKIADTKFDWYAGMFLIVNGRNFRKLGGFDTRFFMYVEDCDFCNRALRIGCKLEDVTVISVKHDARRRSRKIFSKHLFWHLQSLIKYWLKKIAE